MNRPADHARRAELNAEIHARPPESLTPPTRISYLALLSPPGAREGEVAHLASLAEASGIGGPPPGASHFSADLGAFRVKWERHTEFSRYMFIVPGGDDEPFHETALDRAPPDFVAGLPGEVIAAAHAELLPGIPDGPEIETLSRRSFAGNALVLAEIGGGAALAMTDFQIHADGFSRFVIADRRMTRRQAGRLVQRLLEIETYKTLALLAFPVARALGPALGRAEAELADVTAALAMARAEDEGSLLDRLIRLQAEIESWAAANDFRFAAATAYDELVKRRIAELREVRVEGFQTFDEFVERRLAPAMNTCEATAARQESLSRRVARATQLLSTRVNVTQTSRSQDLLHSMNRRADMQLRLQETVEGLSVAAVTYYVVGLVGFLAKGARPLGLTLDPELVMAASIPFVLVFVALGIRRIRRSVSRAGRD